MSREVVPIRQIAQSIYLIRGQRVMLSQDLAILYGVAVKVLNQAVKRNAVRF
ncbi:MAG: DNA-binding protein, partial [Verrucomicrobia bacterium]